MTKLKINCLFKKSFAIFISLSIALSVVLAGGFSAFAVGKDVVEAEIRYGLWYLSQLPSPSENFGMGKAENIESVEKSRYFDKDGEYHDDSIDPKQVYSDMQTQVSELIKGKSTCLEKAEAIYEWVFRHVTYDEKGQFKGANQDAIGVFHSKRAVCFGYANLISLMMRLAGIPCLTAMSHACTHAWNVIYLNDQENGRQGYTVLDACWASCDLHNSIKAAEDKVASLKLDPLTYKNDSLFKQINDPNFPALDKNLTFEAANRKFMDQTGHKMGAVRLGVMADVEDFDYVVKKNGIEVMMHSMGPEEAGKPYLTLNGWKEHGDNICISDDILPVNLPVLLPSFYILGAKKIVISGDARMIFPDAGSTNAKIVGKFCSGLPLCDPEIAIREKLVQMRDKFDFSGSNVYELKGDKLVERANNDRVIFDFTRYDDLSDIATKWEKANEEMIQIYEELIQEREKSDKWTFDILKERDHSLEESKESESNDPKKSKYIEIRQKISDLKQNYRELLKKHGIAFDPSV